MAGDLVMNFDTLARNLTDAMPDALIVSDVNGVIEHWNEGAERLFGFSKA